MLLPDLEVGLWSAHNNTECPADSNLKKKIKIGSALVNENLKLKEISQLELNLLK